MLVVVLEGYKWYQSQDGWCASKDAGLLKGVDCEIPRWLERGNETFLLKL